jgi:hypothetical protein
MVGPLAEMPPYAGGVLAGVRGGGKECYDPAMAESFPYRELVARKLESQPELLAVAR